MRSEKFLDKEPDSTDVPKAVVNEVCLSLPLLRQEWNRMFPENAIFSQEADDE